MAVQRLRRAGLTGRSRFTQYAVRITTASALSVLSLPLLVSPVAASVLTLGGFEIDGNRTVEASPNDDWASVSSASNTDFSHYDHVTDASDVDKQDVVFQSALEDESPDGWNTRPGSNDTGGDILDVETYWKQDASGDAWFYLGFGRREDGVNGFSVELNQAANHVNKFGVSVPTRTPDDVRIMFVQQSGNTSLTGVTIQRWTGTAWGSELPVDGSAFQGTGGTGGLFAELGVDLTRAGLQPDYTEGFTQVNLRGRSSKVDSSFKDYVAPLSVHIPPRGRTLTINKKQLTANGPALGGAAFTITPDPTTANGTSLTVVDGGSNDPDGTADGVITLRTTRYATYSVQEIDPPTTTDASGWILDPATRTATVSLTGSGAVTFVNTLGSVEFTKTDATDGSLVGGATFKLTKSTGVAQGPITVTDNGSLDADPSPGEFRVEGLKRGDWTVAEVNAPTGYTVPSAAPSRPFSVTQNAPDANAGTFEDPRRLATLVVEKRDAGTHNLVTATPGTADKSAVFRLYKDNGVVGTYDPADTQVGSDESSPDGTATWTDLGWGSYLVEEVQPPTGYEPKAGDSAFQSIQIGRNDVDQPGKVVFENDRATAKLEVLKFDFDTGAPLSGATFQLYRDSGTTPGVLDSQDVAVGYEVSADQGADRNSYTWDALPWGVDYLVEETGYPAGYKADPQAVNDAKPVQLTRADTSGVKTVSFNDQRITQGNPSVSTITVTKVDADNNDAPLDGATFELYLDRNGNGAPDANELISSSPTRTGTGTYAWTGLPDGDYLVREANPPTGYDLPYDRVQAVTATGSDYQVGFADTQVKSTIVVTKTDASTGQQLDGATFELYKDGYPYGTKAPDHVPGTGVYTWTGLPFGSYTVKETVAPKGYELPSNATQTVDIDASDAGRTFEVGFEDLQKTSTIVVQKYDVDTDQLVDGATFELFEGTSTVGIAPVHTGTGTYTWSGLAMGFYTVKEVSPPAGYLSPSQDTLPAGDSQTVTIDQDNAGTSIPFAFYDQKQVVRNGTITVDKYDADTRLHIDGATFDAYRDLNGNGSVDTGEPSLGVPSHTGTGTYLWSDLTAGRYLVVESAPPAGYLPPAQAVRPVDLAAGADASVEFYNAPAGSGGTTGGTTLEVTKRDAVTHQPVDTAVFQLWRDANANGTFDGSDQSVGTAESTVAGVVTWSDLATGTYFVQETTAPQGYDLPAAAVITVVVDSSNAGTTVQRSFDDPQKATTLQVVKQDDATGQALAGATFQAYLDVDGDGAVGSGDVAVGEPQVSDQDGLVTWSGLGFGHYLVEEVAAPAGYGLPADAVQSVVIDRGNAGGTIRMVFLDPAQGTLHITKAAWEKDAAGRWVPSDGLAEYGQRVKYVITTRATGAKLFRDAQISDYVPGYAPYDTRTTAKASYVHGSAHCDDTCATTWSYTSKQLGWSLGDLPGGTTRRVSFVVTMPGLPAHASYDENGVHTDTVVNVADLSWTAPAGSSTARASGAQSTLRSNAVVTRLVHRLDLVDGPPTKDPGHVTQGPALPGTGAPAHSGLVTTVGWLSLLLGAWLMLAGRRRDLLPRR